MTPEFDPPLVVVTRGDVVLSIFDREIAKWLVRYMTTGRDPDAEEEKKSSEYDFVIKAMA